LDGKGKIDKTVPEGIWGRWGEGGHILKLPVNKNFMLSLLYPIKERTQLYIERSTQWTPQP
jgi:hypothetical protein